MKVAVGLRRVAAGKRTSGRRAAQIASTYNLAYSLASFGKKVLAVDFDSQANLTTCFGVEDTAAISTTIGHLIML